MGLMLFPYLKGNIYLLGNILPRKGCIMPKPLEKEFDYYLEHQDELVKEYDGKFIVIKDNEVIGVYDSKNDAINNTMESHEIGTFLVQLCEAGEQSYTQTYHSRVIFA